MKIFLAVILIISFANLLNATSEPVCGYEALDGHMEFLRYSKDIQKGQEYIDYGTPKGAVCKQRGICLKDYNTKTEKCSDFDVTCENKKSFSEEFPACCVSC